jgi:hypothetical protein
VSEGRVFWVVDGAGGLGSDGRFFGWLTEQEDLGRMEGLRVVDGTEGSGLEGRVRLVGWKGLRRVQVPGKRLWRIGREEREDRDGPRGPLNTGPRTPSGIPSSTQTMFAQLSARPPTPPLFSFFAPFPCSSAHGRGWEEFRLGPGGSGLATVTFARRRSNRVTNSHPSVRARGKPPDAFDFTVFGS